MAAGTPGWIARIKDKVLGTLTDTYQVECEKLADGSDVAEAAVEAIAAPAGYNLKGVTSRNINRNPLWFEITANYILASLGGSGPGSAIPPLARPSVLTTSYDEWTEPFFKDADNKPVANSAGDRFDTFPQRKKGTIVLQITKNFAACNVVGYDNLKYTTNSVEVTIKGTTYAANTLLFLPVAAQEQFETVAGVAYDYFSVTFRLAADKGLHKVTVDDRGYRCRNSAGELVPILDKTGVPVTTPWTLDGHGNAVSLAPDVAPETITFRPYASAAWGIDFS